MNDITIKSNMDSYFSIRNNRDNYEFLLKKYCLYSEEKSLTPINYYYSSRYTDLSLNKVFNTFSLHRFFGYDEIDTFLKVTRWSHEMLLYDLQDNYNGNEDAYSIISYCRNKKRTVNCRLHAVVLCEALLSMGFQSRLLCCMPIDLLPNDSHTIVSVFSKKLNKWIAIDPSRNCCFYNDSGVLLSAQEIREYLVFNKPINFEYLHRFQFSKESKLKQFDDDWYLDYLYKNFFRFYCSKYNGTTNKMPFEYYHLVPVGFIPIEHNKPYNYNSFTNYVSTVNNCNDFWKIPKEK